MAMAEKKIPFLQDELSYRTWLSVSVHLLEVLEDKASFGQNH